MQTVTRYHDISCGHRVCGHEGKCRYLHGHNYRIHFRCCPEDGLDDLGRVIDFSVIKSRLCQWLEDNWDHRFLIWDADPIYAAFADANGAVGEIAAASFVAVPFNPTAEEMAEHLLRHVGPALLAGTGAKLIGVEVDETRKCSASAHVWQ